MMKDATSVVVSGALASVLLLAGCHRAEQPKTPADLPPVTVQTAAVTVTNVPDLHEIVGTVRPALSASVAAKVTAVMLKVHAQPGAAVKAGDVLAELDDRELRAEYDRAKADYERFKELLAKQVAPQADFDAAQSRYRVAEANLSHAKLLAPFDGIVAQKLADVGDLATPGKPLFVLEQVGRFRLEANVPERFAGNLKLGQELDVVIEALNGRCRGPISEIIPAADPASRSFLIKIALPADAPLKSGLFGRALLPVGVRAAVLVPAAAIHERGQLTFVYVVANGRAQMRLIRTGKPGEVLSGLEAGEQVVVAGTVADGQRVQP